MKENSERMSAQNTADQKQKRRWLRRSTTEVEEVPSVQEKGVTAGKGRATPGRRAQQAESEDQEGNIVTRPIGGVREYIEGVRSELAKVSWPSREDTRRLTVIVLVATILSAIILGIVSFAFTELFRAGLVSPVIFVVFFAAVGIIGFILYRRANNTPSAPY